MFRPSQLFAILPLAALAACNDDTSNFVFVHTANTAVVRFVNATDTPITVRANGVIDTVNTRLGFGQQSSCLLVDLTTTLPLTFTNGVTTVIIPGVVTPPLIGGSFTVVAFAALNGPVQFVALNNAFVPTPGSAGLRFFNAASPAGPLTIRGNGVALSPAVNFGQSTAFLSVSPDPMGITFTNGTVTVLDAGTLAFPIAQSSTIIVGPPSAGSTTFRFFTTVSC